ncbi:hypothetical protein ACFQKF_09425 [Halalkalicoccus sp. GCM10025322]|uniref:hypothetical protein n=1 Tax=Halalkalicoccus TaxID=332246 RepID=UPI002F96635D
MATSQSESGSESTPGNTMRERVGNRRGRIYITVLLNTNRYLVTTGLAIILFVLIVAISRLGTTSLRVAMTTDSPVIPVFQAMIIVSATVVALVVTINQLVLAQEIGPLSDQRDRMSGAMEFLRNAEKFFSSTSPPEPGSFLRALVDTTINNAETLNDAVADTTNDELRERTTQFTEGLVNNATTVSESLEDAQFGQFDVVQAALDYNYAWKIYQVRRLRKDHGTDLTDDQREAFEDLEESLISFGPAREHIKTLYFQWQLVNLSRQIIYIGILAFAVAPGTALFIDAGSFPGTTFGVDNMTWIISGVFTIVTLPVLLLASYTLRLATIAKRTLAIGPFILRSSSRTEDIEWQD